MSFASEVPKYPKWHFLKTLPSIPLVLAKREMFANFYLIKPIWGEGEKKPIWLLYSEISYSSVFSLKKMHLNCFSRKSSLKDGLSQAGILVGKLSPLHPKTIYQLNITPPNGKWTPNCSYFKIRACLFTHHKTSAPSWQWNSKDHCVWDTWKPSKGPNW